MPTIELHYKTDKKAQNPSLPIQRDVMTTASVGASPGRIYTTTINGKAQTFERVGTNASGQEVYRAQVGN